MALLEHGVFSQSYQVRLATPLAFVLSIRYLLDLAIRKCTPRDSILWSAQHQVNQTRSHGVGSATTCQVKKRILCCETLGILKVGNLALAFGICIAQAAARHLHTANNGSKIDSQSKN